MQSVRRAKRGGQPWAFSDPCRNSPFSLPRFLLMTAIFLGLTLGSVPLFLVLRSKPYGLQEASIITYTLFEVFYTFAKIGSRNGPDLLPYRFTCPIVEQQIPRLLRRHLTFLVALLALQTAARVAGPNLPRWWKIEDAKGSTPFELTLLFVCMGLALAQGYTNRSLLDRAHREFNA